mmetsp:Transcript_24996/g.46633  ORF Transcript_24996/g.46633 Transcript_24996/m.46633 type:complete len:233 (+) Transcript_24996:312-1010(+)
MSATSTIPKEVAAAIAMGDNINIGKILQSTGPVVDAVLLSSDATVNKVRVDTTPKKQMVQTILGGPFTFLGQYEDEGIVLMVRRNAEDLPVNAHRLQPPFDETTVRGDILALRVAPQEDSEDPKSNEDFFLDYTKEEYEKFASRTDIVASVTPNQSSLEEEQEDYSEDDVEEDEEMEGEDDSEVEEEGGGFMELLMGQVLQRFQHEHGRMPDEQELKALENAISQKLEGMGE